jgi:hypothetical protein
LISRAMKARPCGTGSQTKHGTRLRRIQPVARHQEDQLAVDLLQRRQRPEQLLPRGHPFRHPTQRRNLLGLGRWIDKPPLSARAPTSVTRQIARDGQQPRRRMLTIGHVIQPPPRDLKRRRDQILSVRAPKPMVVA